MAKQKIQFQEKPECRIISGSCSVIENNLNPSFFWVFSGISETVFKQIQNFYTGS